MTNNVSHASTMLSPRLFRTRDLRSSRLQQRLSEQAVKDSVTNKIVNTFRKYLSTSEVIKGEQKLSPMKETELSDAFSSASLLAEINSTQRAQLSRKRNGRFDYNGNNEETEEGDRAIENSVT